MEPTTETPADTRLGRVLLLAGREARRLARHPVLWLPLAIVAAGVGSEAVTGDRFTAGSLYFSLFVTLAYCPIVAILAANMVASGARRARAEEMLSVTPIADTDRTLALCLGVAVTLGGIGAASAAAMSLIAADGSMRSDELLSAGELVQLPPILAFGGLLGVLTARWLRLPGAVLLTLVVFVGAAVIASTRTSSEPATWWSWWSSARDTDEPFSLGEPAGNPWWHAAYLIGLCACAAVAAVYRDRSQWPKLAAVGLPVAALTLVPGLLQLP